MPRKRGSVTFAAMRSIMRCLRAIRPNEDSVEHRTGSAGWGGGTGQTSKLIIFFMVKTPSDIQIADPTSAILPMSVVQSSEM